MTFSTDTTSIMGNSTIAPAEVADVSSLEFRVLKFCIYVLIFLFSVGGNTLVILSVVLFRRMKSVPNIFIASLATCDLVTTITSIPFDLIEEEFKYFPFGRITCRFLYPLATISTTSACFTLVAISLDRYRAIIHPLNFKYRITRRGCFFIITLIHCLSAFAVVPYIVILHYDSVERRCKENWPKFVYRKLYTIFLFLIQYGMPLLIMSAAYLRLGAVLFKSEKEAHQLSSSSRDGYMDQSKIWRKNTTIKMPRTDNNSDSLRRRKTQNKKTVKMFIFIVIIFLIFMQPNQLFWLWMDFGSPSDFNFVLIAFICRAFTYTNSVLNAVIYGVCNRSFREAFIAIVKCRCSARHEREKNRAVTTSFYSMPNSLVNSRKSSKTSNGKKGYTNGKLYGDMTQNNGKVATANGNSTHAPNGSSSDISINTIERMKAKRSVSFEKRTDNLNSTKECEDYEKTMLKTVHECSQINTANEVKSEVCDDSLFMKANDCQLPLIEAEMILERLFLEIKLERVLDLHPEVCVNIHGVQNCFDDLEETKL